MGQAITAPRGSRQAGIGLPRIIGRRLLQAIPTIALVSIAAFALTLLAPGDPLASRLDRAALVLLTAEQRAEARADLGLDQPLPVQYIDWLGRALTGDFGYSLQSGRPAIVEVIDRLGPTLILMGGALVVAIGVGLTVGVVAARNQGRLADRVLSSAVITLVATPPFVLGLLLIFLLAIQLRIFPAGGMGVAGEPLTLPMLMRHLALPAIVLGLANAAPLARYTRSSMIDVLSSDYIRTARSIGAPEGLVVRRHGYRNASLPIITLIAVLITELLAVAVVTEQVFAWPGLGTLIIRSAQSSDAPVLMVVVLLVSVTTIVVNLIADVLYSVVDPRVRL
jgi:peptide/nickel transport system permease protein